MSSSCRRPLAAADSDDVGSKEMEFDDLRGMPPHDNELYVCDFNNDKSRQASNSSHCKIRVCI